MPAAPAVLADTCTAAQLAAVLGLSTRRVRELAEAGTIPRAPGGRYPTAEAIRAYCGGLRETAAGRRGDGPDGLDLTAERAALAKAQREHVELRLARERGELVDAQAVHIRFAAMVTAARNRLRGVPSKAKSRMHHLSEDDVETLEALIDAALGEVAEGREGAP